MDEFKTWCTANSDADCGCTCHGSSAGSDLGYHKVVKWRKDKTVEFSEYSVQKLLRSWPIHLTAKRSQTPCNTGGYAHVHNATVYGQVVTREQHQRRRHRV